jgi:CRP-like cAMP-binding protein
MILLKQYLDTQFDLSQDETDKFLSIGHKFEAEQGHYLLKSEQVSNRVFFVQEGIIREFEKEGYKEKTSWILSEGNWLYNMPSYYTSNPANCYLQALTDANGYYFMQSNLERLVKESHNWAIAQTDIYRKYLLQMIYRNELHRLKGAANRLAFFEKYQPNIQNRIKLKDIASFLNITQVQLSRVRNERK